MDEYTLQEQAYKKGFEDGKNMILKSGFFYRIPCRIDDDIYVINTITNSKGITVFKVLTLYIDETGLTIACRCKGFTVIRRFKTDDIGHTVFLTRAEAEEALSNGRR